MWLQLILRKVALVLQTVQIICVLLLPHEAFVDAVRAKEPSCLGLGQDISRGETLSGHLRAMPFLVIRVDSIALGYFSFFVLILLIILVIIKRLLELL